MRYMARSKSRAWPQSRWESRLPSQSLSSSPSAMRAVARIALGLEDKLWLGNLDSQRDWGHARDFERAMYLMLQKDAPDDYVIATGEQHSVRDLAERAFAEV